MHKSCAHQRSPVGASLLAKRPSHPTSLSPDTPPSRASPLPQLDFLSFTNPVFTKDPLWERACSRRGRHIQHLH
ncbi:hypothetical protein B0D71_16345 [Pseudomonas laurylsulfativorans]|uniref:Uncharacterized protein n=1 Tax=Pseudomonas laurylsulfativorans TaxID=1943631 RepID=A0A2S3VPB4_9PSED|nr:hypothetical protein B0D71_16345 [Pseudomonas laurylsulfativorans]